MSMEIKLHPLTMTMLNLVKEDHGTTLLWLSFQQMSTALTDIWCPMNVEVATWCIYQANL